MAEEITNMENNMLLNIDNQSNMTSATGDQGDQGDQDKATANDNGAEDVKSESNEPVNERAPAREINEICNKLDISKVFFCPDEPYELPPLSKYFLCEWSEAEHLFKPAMDFAEELFGEWSPCPSPSHSSAGL